MGEETALCIFCLRKKFRQAMSVEHVFPDAIGGTVIFRDVCKPCNDRLGSEIDAPLVNNHNIKVFRQRYDLRGKGGDPVRASFTRGVLEERGGVRTNVRAEPGYLYRVPVPRESGNDIEFEIDPRDVAASESMVAKARRRRPDANVTVRIASDVIDGVVTFPFNIDPSPCWPGLAKIAYEISYAAIGTPFLGWRVAAGLRAYLFRPDCVPERFGLSMVFRAGPPVRSATLDDMHILGGVSTHERQTVCYVRLFNCVDVSVVLNERAMSSFGPRGRFVRLDVTNRRNRFLDPVLASRLALEG